MELEQTKNERMIDYYWAVSPNRWPDGMKKKFDKLQKRYGFCGEIAVEAISSFLKFRLCFSVESAKKRYPVKEA